MILLKGDPVLRKELRNQRNDALIRQYGSDILHSDEFETALSQTHHHRSSVGVHSIMTARAGLTICNVINKTRFHIDERMIVRISLLHDLGMLGRTVRYRNKFMCGYLHPKNSAEAAKDLWDDIDEKSVRAIRSHMWPLSLAIPTSREGLVLCIADKVSAVGDRFKPKNRQELAAVLE